MWEVIWHIVLPFTKNGVIGGVMLGLVRAEAGQVSVCANITALSEAKKALEQGAEDIGLVRTEFLYMNRDTFPTEEEQFNFYKTLALMMPQQDIVIRILDIGDERRTRFWVTGRYAW